MSNIRIVKFSGDEGPMATSKWIAHAQRMVFILNSIPTERTCQDLIIHYIVSNTLAWWQGIEDTMDSQSLADVTIADFREFFRHNLYQILSMDYEEPV